MAAGIMSVPGSKLGPCDPVCGHIDCAQIREDAGRRCPVCGKPIGYGVRFYDTSREATDAGRVFAGETELSHAACIEDQ